MFTYNLNRGRIGLAAQFNNKGSIIGQFPIVLNWEFRGWVNHMVSCESERQAFINTARLLQIQIDIPPILLEYITDECFAVADSV